MLAGKRLASQLTQKYNHEDERTSNIIRMVEADLFGHGTESEVFIQLAYYPDGSVSKAGRQTKVLRKISVACPTRVRVILSKNQRRSGTRFV